MPAPRLLVSVRDAREARAAIAGGAHLIDAKDPSRGALGAVDGGVLLEIVSACPWPLQTSAALGDLGDPARGLEPEDGRRPTFLKVGTGGVGTTAAALRALVSLMERRAGGSSRWVVAAYADHARAQAPSPLEVIEVAEQAGAAGCLLDTAVKDGATLLDWLPEAELGRFVQACRERALLCALAGSLNAGHLGRLALLEPDFIGVRGAACDGDRLHGSVSAARVAALARALRG